MLPGNVNRKSTQHNPEKIIDLSEVTSFLYCTENSLKFYITAH